MKIYHNKTFDCYEDCEQDINAFGKEIFLDGHKLYTKADMVAMLEDLKQDIIAESWGLSAFVEDSKDFVVDVSDIDKVFYEKITALKEQE